MSEQARTRNPWGQGDRLRTEILDAAGALLDRLGGVDAITIRGVARVVGIAPASIYQHFTDRAALVLALVEHDAARLLAVMNAAGEQAAGDPRAQLRDRLAAYATYAIDNPGHHRLAQLRPEGDRMPAARVVVENLRAALDGCDGLRLPADRAAIMLFVAAYGRVTLARVEPLPGDPARMLAFLDEVIDLVLDGGTTA